MKTKVAITSRRLEGRQVITAGVGRLLPPVPPVLPLVVGVVQSPRRRQPRERVPPDHRRLLSEPLLVPVAAS
jgi:hypothetical protein